MRFFSFFEQNNTDVSALGNFDISRTFTFATQLNGGFAAASWVVSIPSMQGSMFARAVLGAIATVYDEQGRYVYNGRVSKAASTGGEVRVSCIGIFEDGGKKTVPTALWLSPETTNGQVLLDCIDLVPSWFGGVGIYHMNVPVGAQDYNGESKVNSIVADMLKVGYTTAVVKPAYLVIYNDQVAEIIVEKGNTYKDYYVSLEGGKVGSSVSLQDVYNKIYILYDDTAEDSVGPTMYPTPANDLGSQSRYGTREGVLNVGEYGLNLGIDLRDLAIQKYASPQSSVPLAVRGHVMSEGGAYAPSYMVRAGQILSIIDNDETAAIHALNEFDTSGFVTSTSFSASSGESKYTLSSSDKKLDYLLARLGLSGGLS